MAFDWNDFSGIIFLKKPQVISNSLFPYIRCGFKKRLGNSLSWEYMASNVYNSSIYCAARLSLCTRFSERWFLFCESIFCSLFENKAFDSLEICLAWRKQAAILFSWSEILSWMQTFILLCKNSLASFCDLPICKAG